MYNQGLPTEKGQLPKQKTLPLTPVYEILKKTNKLTNNRKKNNEDIS